MRGESKIQRTIRHYLALKGYRSVHVPNGSVLRGDKLTRAKQMRNLKSDGLTPGFPDLIVYGPGRIGHIEVKQEGEFATDTQMEVEQWLSEWGHPYAVCRSLEDVDETLRRWGWQ